MSTALLCYDGLDARALLRFVTDPDLFAGDRRVLSWIDHSESGYAYDECTALYGRLYGWLGRARDAIALAEVLEGLLSRQGWLGRDGIGYAFDTALAIDTVSDPTRAIKQVVEWLTAGVACSPITRPGWWSQSYGAHLLKCLPPLARHGRRHLAHAWADDLVDQCFRDGRFRVHADSDVTYVHSHCYAMEGLLGLGTHPDVLRDAADWLAAQMDSEGAFPAWIGAPNDRRPSDVVAQSVRLFAAVDRPRFHREIDRGLQRLAELQDGHSGGIRYTLASTHINTWASAFALQAIHWASNPPTPADIAWLV